MIHAKNLLRLAIRLCNDHSRAEDLVQETLLSAWRNFHQYEAGSNCRAWLCRILVNRRNRDFSKNQEPAKTHDVDSIPSSTDPVSKTIEVRSALARLSEEHRTILSLAVVEGLSIKELADLLQIPCGTVMSRLSRARAVLKELLTPKAILRELP